MTKRQSQTRFMVIIGTMLILTTISTLFGLAWPLMEVQAGPTLPPRKPPPVAPSGDEGSDEDKDDSRDAPLLAHIELHTQSAPAGAWSVVQWQDLDGNWHDVEGWRSVLQSGGYQRWTVESKDFGTGPFRWQVTRGPEGAVLGISGPFNLPAGAGEMVPVVVSPGS